MNWSFSHHLKPFKQKQKNPAGEFSFSSRGTILCWKFLIYLLFCIVMNNNSKKSIWIFQKTLQVFTSTIWNGWKTLRVKSKFGIKPYQSFSAIITIKQTCFLYKFYFLIVWKNPAGFFPHLKMWGENPARGWKNPANPHFFFYFNRFFHHDGIYFFSHNYICFAPLCLYLCNLVVLSLLHHWKDDVILPNSGVAKKTGGCSEQSLIFHLLPKRSKAHTKRCRHSRNG